MSEYFINILTSQTKNTLWSRILDNNATMFRKMSKTKMIIIKQMSNNTLRARITTEFIHMKFEVIPSKDK